MTPDVALSVDDLFIREHRTQRRTPVDKDLVLEGQTLLEELQENLLCPAHIVWIGRVDFTRPVVTKAEHLELSAKVLDVLLRRRCRMRTRSNRVLLRGQTKGTPTHWMQHVITSHTTVTTKNVRRRVSLGMSYVQTRA